MNQLSVYGSTGFIGSEYCKLFNDNIEIPRDQDEPETNNLLYFISTIHNYNVFDNINLDVSTNLVKLLDVIQASNSKYGYSITKRTAEQLIMSYCETFGIKYRILRLCNVYGDYDKKSSKKRNALQYLIEEVVKGNDINLYDCGENIRDFLHIRDVCRAIKLTVDSDKTINKIINIGSGVPTKFIDVMNYVKTKTNSCMKVWIN